MNDGVPIDDDQSCWCGEYKSQCQERHSPKPTPDCLYCGKAADKCEQPKAHAILTEERLAHEYGRSFAANGPDRDRTAAFDYLAGLRKGREQFQETKNFFTWDHMQQTKAQLAAQTQAVEGLQQALAATEHDQECNERGLIKRIEALESERDTYKHQRDVTAEANQGFAKQCTALKEENARMREALEFYAGTALDGTGCWQFRKPYVFDVARAADCEKIEAPMTGTAYFIAGRTARAALEPSPESNLSLTMPSPEDNVLVTLTEEQS